MRLSGIFAARIWLMHTFTQYMYMENNTRRAVPLSGTYPVPQEESGTRSLCQECGAPVYGRPDKKFCCDSCKNRWHNRRARSSRLFRMKVMSALEKNYRILSDLLVRGTDKVEVSTLGQMGFDFYHITGYRKVRKSAEMWCYDIRFTVTESVVKSIRKVEYL